jgi:penicillin-binding protein 2
MLSKTQPQVIETIEADASVWSTVKEGMIRVASAVKYPLVGGSWIFRGLKDTPAIKTGTPQVTKTEFNSALVGYYPASDPEIAFGIALEKGEYTKLLLREIIDAYEFGHYDPALNSDGTVMLLPWNPWTP